MQDQRKENELLMIILTSLCEQHQSSGRQVFHHMHVSGRQPTDRNQKELRSQRLQHNGDLSL